MPKFRAEIQVTRQYAIAVEAENQGAAEKEAERRAEEGGFCEGKAETLGGCLDEEIEVMDVEAL